MAYYKIIATTPNFSDRYTVNGQSFFITPIDQIFYSKDPEYCPRSYMVNTLDGQGTQIATSGFKPTSEGSDTAEQYYYADVVNIYIQRDYRKQGHGRQLLFHTLTEAKRRGFRSFLIRTPIRPARQFYMKSFEAFQNSGLISEINTTPFSTTGSISVKFSETRQL